MTGLSRRKTLILLALIAGLGAIVLARGTGTDFSDRDEMMRPYMPAVRMDRDKRATPKEFARRNGISWNDIRKLHGATGLVRCGQAVGTAQLTLRNDVIVTAAHVLIEENGQARSSTCEFTPMMDPDRGPVEIDLDSIRFGSDNPKSEPATRDWAVARLVRPIHGVRPYGLAPAGTTPSAVVMCAGGNGDYAAMGTEHCSARKVIGVAPDGIRELAIDCNAGPGSSGAALIGAENKIVGIYVGYRSAHPDRPLAFSAIHYNFAITVEGPFRRALLALATAKH